MTEVVTNFKSDDSTPGHPRGCPCRPCVGRRARRSGKKKQAAARKALEAQTSSQAHWRGHLANEESWSHLPVRVEIKSGAQCGPAWTRFLAAEKQANVAHAVGDPRPFVNIMMAKDSSDGLLVFRLSDMERVVSALSHE